jgi:hypothetical protein
MTSGQIVGKMDTQKQLNVPLERNLFSGQAWSAWPLFDPRHELGQPLSVKLEFERDLDEGFYYERRRAKSRKDIAAVGAGNPAPPRDLRGEFFVRDPLRKGLAVPNMKNHFWRHKFARATAAGASPVQPSPAQQQLFKSGLLRKSTLEILHRRFDFYDKFQAPAPSPMAGGRRPSGGRHPAKGASTHGDRRWDSACIHLES